MLRKMSSLIIGFIDTSLTHFKMFGLINTGKKTVEEKNL